MPEFVVAVRGSGMAPLFMDGDLVCCRLADTVEDGQPAVIQMYGVCTIKIISARADSLVLSSPNLNFPPITCPKSDVRIIGRPVGLMRSYEQSNPARGWAGFSASGRRAPPCISFDLKGA